MIEIVCQHCGSVFRNYPSNNRKFCSSKCCFAGKKSGTHRESETKLHEKWCGMRSRCRRVNHPLCKKYYIDKGITVCKEWDSYETFKRWAIESGYVDGLEIDRIDNEKGYSPDNCRWATRVQQMANRKKVNRRNATSQYKGVAKVKRKLGFAFTATVSVDNWPVHVGTFKTEVEAAIAYDKRAIEMYGEFASLNFPNGVDKCQTLS